MCVSYDGLMNIMDITCYACAGRKEVLGLGNMRKKCLQCAGTGYIKNTEKEKHIPDSGTENNQKNQEVKKNKTGRPKKVR